MAQLLIGVALSFPAGPAFGVDSQRALLDLSINEVAKGVVLVWLRSGDVLAGTADLEKAGLHGFAGTRETVNGTELVSLQSLAPEVVFESDPIALSLRITAVPRLLGRTSLDFGVGRPNDMLARSDPSAFLNYSLSSGGTGSLDVALEAGVGLGRSRFLSDLWRRDGEGVTRGMTRWVIDDRSRQRRWVIGDELATSSSRLGGGALLGGLGLVRDFSLDPYLIRTPAQNLVGTLLTPSTVEVYINGMLARREQLPPGEFTLRNLPLPSGRGETRLVVRDAFGRESEMEAPYYLAAGLLAPGLAEYGYHLGFRREGLATPGSRYRELAFLGHHRQGVRDWLTLGGSLEASGDLLSAGSQLTLGLPAGEVELDAAASIEKGEHGFAGALGYNVSARRFSLGTSLVSRSARFANLGLPAVAERTQLEVQGSFGISIGRRLGLTLQAGHLGMRDGADRDRFQLSANVRLAGRATLFLVASHAGEPGPNGTTRTDRRLLATLHLNLIPGLTTRLSGELSESGLRSTAEVQRLLPSKNGYGYRLNADRAGEETFGRGELRYQGPFGLYEISHQASAHSNATFLNAAGGLVAIGGRIHPTRPVLGGFALVEVPGAPGVRVYRSNQEVGRTGARGDFLVSDLLADYGNRLRIADQDLPVDYTVEASEKTVAPAQRSGVVVRFPAWRLRAFKGKISIRTSEGERVPYPGLLTVTAGERNFISLVGTAGEIYLENVPPGEHPAVVESGDTRCSFLLTVPAVKEALSDLGSLVCDPPGERRP